jgi:hypothetical protein
MNIIKKIFKFFWEETSIKIGNSVFEMGGFIISLAITILILWLLGLFNN